MASTNPLPDDATGPPLLPFSGVDAERAFDLPYAEDPQALPPPPASGPPPAALPPPPSFPASAGALVAEPPRPFPPGPPGAPPGPDEAADPTALREPRPFLPPNFSTPGAVAAAVASTSRPPHTMPPPLSAQPFSGPVVSIDPEEDNDGGGGPPAASEPVPALPPMVAARTFDPDTASTLSGGAPSTPATIHPTSDQPGSDVEAPVASVPAPPAPPPILSSRRVGSELASPTAPAFPASPESAPTRGPAPTGPLTMSPEAPFPTMAVAASNAVEPANPGAPATPATLATSIPPLVPGSPGLRPTVATPAGQTTEAVPGAVSASRVADGILVGTATAALAGATWWAVVALTERQFPYLALFLGLLVGQGVLIGSRRGSVALGALAGVLTLASLSVAQYFIARSLAIAELGLDLPLWQDAGEALDVIRGSFQDDGLSAVFVLLAAGLAASSAGRASARPVR